MKKGIPVILAAWLVLPVPLLSAADSSGPDPRPNIVLIVADDLGYADLGSYGGDISTPNIDQLAAQGMLFTQFHTAPYCAPTRAMLLSGNNNHVAGMASQGADGLLDHPFPGYENHLSPRIAPFPGLLRESGYHTYMVGKWHLGTQPENSPTAAGFERSLALLHGAGNHWDEVGFFEGGSEFWSDGAYIDWPEGSYSTNLFTDSLLSFIEQDRDDKQPFFAFAAYTTPHWPLTVPDDYLDRYAGSYDQGYDQLRHQRFASLKAAGIIPGDSQLPPRNEAITPWDSLDEEKQKREARKMELYAAMVEHLDMSVGRLVKYLKDEGLYENTLIVFMSDNGAAGEDFYNSSSYMDYVRANYDNSYENMGRPGSFVSYGPQWAEAGSAPFSRYKGYTREGGITAPMVIAGAGVAKQGVMDRSYLTVMDLAPTFLDIAGAKYPQNGTLVPMLGESAVGLLSGKTASVHDDNYLTVLSHRGRTLVRQGDWKLVTLEGPFDEEEFELFNLADDPGETRNLATQEAEMFASMMALWQAERVRLGILVPDDL